MKKQIQLFLNHEDEIQFTAMLVRAVPGMVFLNDNVWPSIPDQRNGIEDCSSGRVYLFEGPLDILPTKKRKAGDLEGPTSGCVVQVLRPRVKEGVIFSGRVATGFDDADGRMKSFVSKIWKCLEQVGIRGVLTPGGEVNRNYLIGKNLVEELKGGSVCIADRATGIQMRLL